MEPRKRVATQKELLKISGYVNLLYAQYSGSEKVNELFEKVFYEGLEKIQNKLETEKFRRKSGWYKKT